MNQAVINHMQGKRILLEMLLAEGVEMIFGNPGTSEAPMLDIMNEYPQLRYVLALQEGTAVGMADGYWRATGKTPCVSLHIDNGLVNGFSLMIDQKYTYAPAVVMAGNKDIRKLTAGRSDLAEMARPFSKWSAEITTAEQIAPTIRRAFKEATSPMAGPVFLSMSANAFDETAVPDLRPSAPVSLPGPDSQAVQDAAKLLASAKRPILITGDRLSQYGGEEAITAAVKLAETAGMPVYGHYSNSLAFPAMHPLWQGIGMPRMDDFRDILANADVVLAAGCPVFEDFFHVGFNLISRSANLIHVDVAADEIGKSERTNVGIVSTPGLALSEIETALIDIMTGTIRETAKGRYEKAAEQSEIRRKAFAKRAADGRRHRPMASEAMAVSLAEAIPEETLVYNDGISAGAHVFEAMSPSRPGNYFKSRGQAIGWGMGATVGLQLGSPNSPVVGVMGDGSAIMTIQALWTAVNERAPAIFVICNNSSYRILKINMNHYRRLTNQKPPSGYFAMDFSTPLDFAKQAEAYGARGVRVENPADIGGELQKAFHSGQPTVLDVIIDGSL